MLRENTFKGTPHLNKNGHGLLKGCWRILHRKRRILRSPAPNELPG